MSSDLDGDIDQNDKPQEIAGSDTLPNRDMRKRLGGRRERHRQDADDFFNGTWY